jgi:hypothetical protein
VDPVSTGLVEYSDVVFVEPPRDSQVIVSIAGQFSLSDRRNRRGERRVFQCRAVYLSTHAVGFVSPVGVKVGERIIAHIERLGRLEGIVQRVLERGFLMSISASAQECDRLADKIEWLEKHKNHDVAERRADLRMTPGDMYSRVVLPDGNSETCQVLNISASGAALSAEAAPEVGTVLIVGKVVGHVVRHFDGGFAVQFIERQPVVIGSKVKAP